MEEDSCVELFRVEEDFEENIALLVAFAEEVAGLLDVDVLELGTLLCALVCVFVVVVLIVVVEVVVTIGRTHCEMSV